METEYAEYQKAREQLARRPRRGYDSVGHEREEGKSPDAAAQDEQERICAAHAAG